jgi:murein DD-endopeptidase MepM/ murein hydrolase activator NlpD
MQKSQRKISPIFIISAGILLFFLIFVLMPTSQTDDDIMAGYDSTSSFATSKTAFKTYISNIKSQAKTTAEFNKTAAGTLSEKVKSVLTYKPTGDADVTVTARPGVNVPEYGNGRHLGVDVAPRSPGTNIPLYAAMDGHALKKYGNDIGNTVDISRTITSAGNINPTDIVLRYFHLNDVKAEISDKDITAGTEIGHMGNTGKSSGVHLHLELWAKAAGIWRVYNAYPILYENKNLEDLPYMTTTGTPTEGRTGTFTPFTPDGQEKSETSFTL